MLKPYFHTLYGKGEIVATNYKLKQDTVGWWKAFDFADQDFPFVLKKGTIVNKVVRFKKSGKYLIITELKGSDVLNGLFENSTADFESNLIEKK